MQPALTLEALLAGTKAASNFVECAVRSNRVLAWLVGAVPVWDARMLQKVAEIVAGSSSYAVCDDLLGALDNTVDIGAMDEEKWGSMMQIFAKALAAAARSGTGVVRRKFIHAIWEHMHPCAGV